jgi:flavin-dependent dehydrogenase
LQRNFDVIIVGAGPSGATLAGELAQTGVSVALMEKESMPRYKCCGGGLSIRAAKLIHQDISDTLEDEITGVTFIYADGKSYSQHDTKAVGYAVMRSEFDYALTRQAEKAGAVVLQECEVKRICMDDERLQVFTALGNFQSKFIAGADGSMGVVARCLNLKKKSQLHNRH